MLKNLSLSQKISMLLIVCILPSFVLLSFFIAEIETDIEFSKKELVGAEIITPIISMKTDLFLLNLSLLGNKENSDSLEESIHKKMNLLKDIPEETKTLLQLRTEDLELRKLSFVNLDSIIANWEKSKDVGQIETKREQLLKLIENLDTLSNHISNTSNLLLDPETDSFHLMDLFVAKIPQVLKLLNNSFKKLEPGLKLSRPLSTKPINEEMLNETTNSLELQLTKAIQENSLTSNTDIFIQTKLKEAITPLTSSLYNINSIQYPYPKEELIQKYATPLTQIDQSLVAIQTGFSNLIRSRIDKLESRKINGSLIIVLACTSIVGLGITLLRKWIRQLESNFEQLKVVANNIHLSSDKLQESASKSAAAASQEAAAIQETVAAMTQMNSMLKQSSSHTESASHLARQTFEAAEKGKRTMEEMSSSIENIAHANSRLKEITKVIEDIATRTNIINDIVFKTQLLAVNASIEAARAGHHGKGFAVVANEVGNLASLSGKAAFEIRELLDDSKQKVSSIISNTASSVDNGKNVSQQAFETFNSVLDSIEQINNKVQQIFEATKEQELGVKQSSQAMTEMNHATISNNGLAQENSKLSSDIKEQADRLEKTQTGLQTLISGNKKLTNLSKIKKMRISKMDAILNSMDTTLTETIDGNDIIHNRKLSDTNQVLAESNRTNEQQEPEVSNSHETSHKVSLAAKLSAKLSSRQNENSIASLSDLKIDKNSAKTTVQSRFEWSQNYDIGVDSMNGEHKKLLKLMKELETAFNEKRNNREQLVILKELAEYTIKHFQDEEQYLASIQYPELDPHKMIHANLLNKLGKFAEKFESQGFIEEDFFSFLKTWLSAHIQGVDMKYGTYSKTYKKAA